MLVLILLLIVLWGFVALFFTTRRYYLTTTVYMQASKAMVWNHVDILNKDYSGIVTVESEAPLTLKLWLANLSKNLYMQVVQRKVESRIGYTIKQALQQEMDFKFEYETLTSLESSCGGTLMNETIAYESKQPMDVMDIGLLYLKNRRIVMNRYRQLNGAAMRVSIRQWAGLTLLLYGLLSGWWLGVATGIALALTMTMLHSYTQNLLLRHLDYLNNELIQKHWVYIPLTSLTLQGLVHYGVFSLLREWLGLSEVTIVYGLVGLWYILPNAQVMYGLLTANYNVRSVVQAAALACALAFGIYGLVMILLWTLNRQTYATSLLIIYGYSCSLWLFF